MTAQPPKNLTNELAKERNRAAAERTQLAWIRTSLSFISFGFGIDRIIAAIEHSQVGANVDPVRATRIIGFLLAALGTYGIFAATLQHYRILKRIQRDDYLYSSEQPISLIVSIGLMLVGVLAVVSLLVKSAIH